MSADSTVYRTTAMTRFKLVLLLVLVSSPSLGFAPVQTLKRPATYAMLPTTSLPTWPRRTKKTQKHLVALSYGEARGVDAQLLFDTWEWNANLGAPAALVAGAALATMVESRESMSPKKSDTPRVQAAKKLCRFLLLSSFALEVISIFVTTVTGTMLLSHGDTPGKLANLAFNSPMGFFMGNWEFEYLTARIAFLQGLFHWLASVAMELLIPKKAEGVAARRMNMFTSSALMTIIVAMLSFLNRHMTFYKNYAHMLRRYAKVCFAKFFWPVQPLTVLLGPLTIISAVLGYRAFACSGDLEEDD